MNQVLLRMERQPQARPTSPALRKQLKLAAQSTLKLTEFAEPCEISLLLTDDQGIQALNRDWRGKDAPTDVLSFPQEDDGLSTGPVLLGDIVINTSRCRQQALELEHSYDREFVFLFVHGLLHLLGWDHERSVTEEEEMFALQRQVVGGLEWK